MTIPGLDLNSVATNIVDTGYKSQLDAISDASERAAKRQQLLNYFISGDGKPGLEKEIKNIEDSCDILQNSITQLQTVPATILPPGVTPQVIVTGTAVGAPNPAWPSLFNAAMKPGLITCCTLLEFVYNQILNSCDTISFTPAPQIIALKAQLTAAKAVINGL